MQEGKAAGSDIRSNECRCNLEYGRMKAAVRHKYQINECMAKGNFYGNRRRRRLITDRLDEERFSI